MSRVNPLVSSSNWCNQFIFNPSSEKLLYPKIKIRSSTENNDRFDDSSDEGSKLANVYKINLLNRLEEIEARIKLLQLEIELLKTRKKYFEDSWIDNIKLWISSIVR